MPYLSSYVELLLGLADVRVSVRTLRTLLRRAVWRYNDHKFVVSPDIVCGKQLNFPPSESRIDLLSPALAVHVRKIPAVFRLPQLRHLGLLYNPNSAILGLVDEPVRCAAVEELLGLRLVVTTDDHGAAGEITPGLQNSIGHGF